MQANLKMIYLAPNSLMFQKLQSFEFKKKTLISSGGSATETCFLRSQKAGFFFVYKLTSEYFLGTGFHM